MAPIAPLRSFSLTPQDKVATLKIQLKFAEAQLDTSDGDVLVTAKELTDIIEEAAKDGFTDAERGAVAACYSELLLSGGNTLARGAQEAYSKLQQRHGLPGSPVAPVYPLYPSVSPYPV